MTPLTARPLRFCRSLLVTPILFLAFLFLQTASFALGTNPVTIASTVPNNGDVNPYGIARVPRSTGSLVKGNILVSNFNNSKNLQGTGTTIVQSLPPVQYLYLLRLTRAPYRPVSRRDRVDHRSRGVARRLGHCRKPADNRWDIGDCAGRMLAGP